MFQSVQPHPTLRKTGEKPGQQPRPTSKPLETPTANDNKANLCQQDSHTSCCVKRNQRLGRLPLAWHRPSRWWPVNRVAQLPVPRRVGLIGCWWFLADGFGLFIAMFDKSSQEAQSWLTRWLIMTAVEWVIRWLADGELMVNKLVDWWSTYHQSHFLDVESFVDALLGWLDHQSYRVWLRQCWNQWQPKAQQANARRNQTTTWLN